MEQVRLLVSHAHILPLEIVAKLCWWFLDIQMKKAFLRISFELSYPQWWHCPPPPGLCVAILGALSWPCVPFTVRSGMSLALANGKEAQVAIINRCFQS